MVDLFTPIDVGAIKAQNRVFMAPMTRARATSRHIPTPMMTDYYRQRATAGLIISEAVGISREGLGWPYAPGIWSQAQVEAWKPVTAAVHERGGKIVAQLWHMGRAVHSSVTGQQPVAPSAIVAPGLAHTYDGKMSYEQPRALDIADIARILDDYAHAARNALAAGFDGVQLHAANGYLIDQFLRDSTNCREDGYGGEPGNRLRFLREVVERVADAVGASRTAVRLSPNAESKGCIDSDSAALFLRVAELLDGIGLAFLELREPGPNGTFDRSDSPKLSPAIRQVFTGPLVLNQDYTPEAAAQALHNGTADAIAFGRTFISNPDLVHRLRARLPLAPDDRGSWYSQGAEGYTDYPNGA